MGRFESILISVGLLWLGIGTAFPDGPSERSRVLVVPIWNPENDLRCEIVCAAVTDTIALTLRLMERYQVRAPESSEPFADLEDLRTYCADQHIDQAIYGWMQADAQSGFSFSLAVFDRIKDAVTIAQEASSRGLFDVFAVADSLVASLLEALSGQHIGFGSIELIRKGEEGDFAVYLDGNLAGKNILTLPQVLYGKRNLVIKQNRFLGEEVLLLKELQVLEDERAIVEFEIPYLVEREAQELERLQGAIERNWNDPEKASVVEQSIAQAIDLVINISSSPHLVRLRREYELKQILHAIKRSEWLVVEDPTASDPSPVLRIAEAYADAGRFLEPDKIRGEALQCLEKLFPLIRVSAINDATARNKSGAEKYKTLKRIAEQIPQIGMPDFSRECDLVLSAFQKYEENGAIESARLWSRVAEHFGPVWSAARKLFRDYGKVQGKELIVLSEPLGLSVAIDGKSYGRTPLRVGKLRSNEIRVVASDAWYETRERSVMLDRDRTFLYLASEPVKDPALLPVASPARLVSKKMYEFSWSPIAGAARYGIQILADDGNSESLWREYGNIAGTKFAIDDPWKAGQRYSYRVCAANKRGVWGPWSVEASFEGQMEWKEAGRRLAWLDKSHAPGGVVFQGKMWILGGLDSAEVWFTEDGRNWQPATLDAPYGRRGNYGAVVLDNKIWVIAGRKRDPFSRDREIVFNDVWCSEDGKNWQLVTSSAKFPPRDKLVCLTYRDMMWVIGGSNEQGSEPWYRDVWSSRDGLRWNRVTSSTEFVAGLSGVVFKDRMWICEGHEKSISLWHSKDGSSWTPATPLPIGIRERQGHVVHQGKMWIIGGSLFTPLKGRESTETNDIWFSDDGSQWKQSIPATSHFEPRGWFISLDYRDRLWILGGHKWSPNYSHSDVWSGRLIP